MEQRQAGKKLESEATGFNGVKTFTATMARDRDALGDRVTAWLRADPQRKVIDTVVTQSSDESFHCLAITVFFWQPEAA